MEQLTEEKSKELLINVAEQYNLDIQKLSIFFEKFGILIIELGQSIKRVMAEVWPWAQKAYIAEMRARRRVEIWQQYEAEKAKMSNNERRRRGLPLVRRPKKYQLKHIRIETGRTEK